MKSVAAQATSAHERIGELESELGSTREALAQSENENRSLQSSLELMVGENARLSRRLLEECAACDTVSSRLERVNVTLSVTDAECEKLIAAAAEADRKHQNKTDELQTRLNAIVTRAAAAEAQLAEVQRALHACNQEKNTRGAPGGRRHAGAQSRGEQRRAGMAAIAFQADARFEHAAA